MPSELKKILLLALGGEGGGTLTEWIVQAGIAMGWPIQATSIPGVAQRTGATSYYIECLPRVLQAGETAPPMCLAPLAGDLDLIVSSELLETARALERGMASPSKTHLISSTARSLTTIERMQMGDGRYDSEAIFQAAKTVCKETVFADMSQLASSSGAVMSSVMFGALAASAVLPFSREVCERVMTDGDAASKRSKANLNGFLAGFSISNELKTLVEIAGTAPEIIASKNPAQHQNLLGFELPEPVASMAALGAKRLQDFQNEAYAKQYLEIVQSFCSIDTKPFAVSQEAARTLALWMAYEDIIRVADLKSRASRFEQIRRDYGAKAHEPVIVRDFLKPGLAEIADILPPFLSKRLQAWSEDKKRKQGSDALGQGIMLQTSAVSGLLLMRLLAGMKFLRPKSQRYAAEQALIKRWRSAFESCLRINHGGLSLEMARLPELIKGYSDTHARGKANFLRILETLIEPALSSHCVQADGLANQLKQAFQAANAAPDGLALLDALGLPRPLPAVREQVIHFAKPMNARNLSKTAQKTSK